MNYSVYNAETGETIIRELTQEELDELAAIELPQITTYRIGKSTPWRRMTDDEAVNVKQIMAQQPVRMQMIYDAAAYLDTADELFVQLRNILTALFGQARSDELLAPETSDGN